MSLVVNGGPEWIGETVMASSKETRCFLRLAAAFAGSNSKLRGWKFMRWLSMPF
jgi:hypothetical protein